MDVRALPLTPMEGFVLSRIDGSATIDDLADLTSLDSSDVLEMIEKLISHGAVEWADGAISLPRASLRPGATPSHAIDRRALRSSVPFVRANVTESQPPAETREPQPGLRMPPPPRVPRPSSLPGNDAPQSESGRRSSETRISPASVSRPGTVVRVNARERAASNPSVPSSRTGNVEPPQDDPTSTPVASPSPAPAPPPAADASEIELSPDRRARIDELYPVLDLLGHYEVLGLAPTVEAKDIRTTYFELSKVFHPDTAFRKNLGPYKARMEAIFARLTEAYEVLGKKKSRAEYDAYLVLQGDTRAVEAAMRTPAPPAPPQSAPTVAAEPPPSPPVATAPEPEPTVAPAPTRVPSDEARRRARELLEKRLGGARPSSSSAGAPRPLAAAPTPASPAPPRDRDEPAPPRDRDAPAPPRDRDAPAPPRDREAIVRDLASSLKSTASITGGLDRVARHAREAQRLEQDGDLAAASRELRAALSLAPMRDDLRLEQERVARLLSTQLADKYQQAAEYEEKHKKWAAAATSWSKVVEGRPDDVAVLLRAAIALVEAKGDLHKAQRFALRACDLRPDDVVARRTLGRVYLAAGLQLNARRELERASLLDPGDQIVKNLLGELKG